ncbi:endonuclease/Exonuclease/phosphatase [Xylariaceae sp. FL0594]|nr:endonuclease/Exonuclease/phosphatase [Xylariaceae sp. FL0594]
MKNYNQALGALLFLSGGASATAAATSGSFNVLSMNVAGLPAILNNNDVPGNKKTNSEMIGTKFSQLGYDIIHVQEDFNYHAYIYKTDTHPYRTATSGGVPFGSGLNTLSNYPFEDFARVKWDECSNASGADCLTPKGFTFMRVALSPSSSSSSEGVYIDVYNLHADAGTEDGDLDARASNIRQLSSTILSQSSGNAVLVYGDTNSRYTRARDVISVLGTENGLTDTWVELTRAGSVPPTPANPDAAPPCANPAQEGGGDSGCEVVDKILYRGSPLLHLSATHFAYESAKFLQPDGSSVLSDHNPITANFTWSTASTPLRQSPFFGGDNTGGTWFSDVPALAAKLSSSSSSTVIKISTITFRGASRLDSVAVTLADGTNLVHGGDGGVASSLALDVDAGETWVVAHLCKGLKNKKKIGSGQMRNFYIKATTSTGRVLEAGTPTDDCATFEAPPGWAIVGFLGRDGDEMDKLAFVYAPQ